MTSRRVTGSQARLRESGDEDVLGDAQVAEQVQFLVNERHPAPRCLVRMPRRVGSSRPSSISPASGGWLPPRMFIERGLARPVLPDQPQGLPACKVEADVLEHRDAEEALADAVEFQDRQWRRTWSPA